MLLSFVEPMKEASLKCSKKLIVIDLEISLEHLFGWGCFEL